MKYYQVCVLTTVGILACTSSVHAVTLQGVALGVGGALVGVEVVGQGINQVNGFFAWANSSDLSTIQVKQVQNAINYLNDKGFVNEAEQAQTMLNNSRHWFRKRLGSTITYKRIAESDAAETYGGPFNAVFNNATIV